MKLLILFSLGLIAATSAVSFIEVSTEEWTNFKIKHNKNYEAAEEKLRYKIYLENRHTIAKHNRQYHLKNVTYKLDVNKYADMLHSEFVRTFNGFNRTTNNPNSVYGRFAEVEEPVTFIGAANVELPKQVDWREKGAVTPIKDQGHCGSCWSFSATGALEGQHFRKSGKLVSLSEQNLVDCSGKYGNNGCNGGLMDQAFQYIKDNGGVDTETAYPYEGEDEPCRFKKQNVGATDKGFVDLPAGDEDALMKAAATIGPISVAIDASQQSFQFYSGGVYYEPECSSQELDHGVLLVGYGTDEESHQDYWLVKNSWGTAWGDNGYIKMARNQDNNCGIASQASYPLV